jgi:transcription antitermination factor NusG
VKDKEQMEVGSSVRVSSGTHKGQGGKVIAMSKGKAGEVSKVDFEAYVSVELEKSKSIVQVKRKKLELESMREPGIN